MRQLCFAAALAVVIAGSAQAGPPQKRSEKSVEAPSAAAHATAASVQAASLGKGYTARERRMADCLASAPGYDPAIDRIRLRNGATRPCRL